MGLRLMLAAALTIGSPVLLTIAVAMALATVLIARIRRIRMPLPAAFALLTGLLLLAIAAGDIVWHRAVPHDVAVMVDLSASTRTAHYRDRVALQRRIEQLLGATPHRVIYFASDNRTQAPEGAKLPDLPADHTVYQPPPVAAVLLCSDGRFEAPAVAPPTYFVVDPILDDPPDASVDRLELRGEKIAATVTNHSSDPRVLAFSPAQSVGARKIGRGTFVVTQTMPQSARGVSVAVSGDDPWPENDRLTLLAPPPMLSERWWVGGGGPTGWRSFSTASLPLDAAEYLAPAVIVLNNVSATEVSEAQQNRLAQYVRDLGGALVILGGDRAFAAGGYTGTQLDRLSPLASSPPEPRFEWILLADSSGSMAASENGVSRWDLVTEAITRLIPHLPPDDQVRIASFAQDLHPWTQGPARSIDPAALPPDDVRPSGPTNLEQALAEIISRSASAFPKRLLILTDADADITQLDQLRAGLREKKIGLYVLDTYGKGRGRDVLRQLAEWSGGGVIQELDPKKWFSATQKLLQMASPKEYLVREATPLRFSGDVASLPGRSVPIWNRVWIRTSALPLAQTTAADGPAALAARWQVGSGQVLAAGFSPQQAELDAFAKLVAQTPRDSRFKVTWDPGRQLRVSVDAADNDRYLNGEQMTLELRAAATEASPQSQSPRPNPLPEYREREQEEYREREQKEILIPQIAPGRYEVSVPAPRQPVFASVRRNGQVLDRTAVAGRYAPEFDAIGNDMPAMRELAARTGGGVILPTQTRAIEFHWQTQPVPLTSWLAAAGALFIAAGLLRWRWV
jgi:hypothetical protein